MKNIFVKYTQCESRGWWYNEISLLFIWVRVLLSNIQVKITYIYVKSVRHLAFNKYKPSHGGNLDTFYRMLIH